MKQKLCMSSDSAPPSKKRRLGQGFSNAGCKDIESSASPSDLQNGRFQPGQIVFEDDEFQFEFLFNDHKEQHLIALTDLKQIFAACLPRMGTRYVTRHVFDEHHRLICCRSKSNHSNATLNHEDKQFAVRYPVIGGICIRPFYEQHFAEVVFLAVSNAQQNRSVGRKIMRVMKHAAVLEHLHHFYTYADNQAIGFFEKMGFVNKRGAAMHAQQSSVANDNKNTRHKNSKEPFWDYIKHYTGSSLMECKLYTRIDYVQLDEHLRAIETDVYAQCLQHRQTHFASDFDTVYGPPAEFLIPMNKLIFILDLDDYADEETLLNVMHQHGLRNDRDLYDLYHGHRSDNTDLQQILIDTFQQKCGEEIYAKLVTYLTKPNNTNVTDHIDLQVSDLEGVKPEWKRLHAASNDAAAPRVLRRSEPSGSRRSVRFFPVHMKVKWVLKRVMKNDDAYPFNEPVPQTVPGYYDRIKHPMDMRTMNEKNERGEYEEWKQFEQDFRLMVANCKEFNQPNSEIVKMCIRLNEYCKQIVIKYDKTMNERKNVK